MNISFYCCQKQNFQNFEEVTRKKKKKGIEKEGNIIFLNIHQKIKHEIFLFSSKKKLANNKLFNF